MRQRGSVEAVIVLSLEEQWSIVVRVAGRYWNQFAQKQAFLPGIPAPASLCRSFHVPGIILPVDKKLLPCFDFSIADEFGEIPHGI
jgi:hypothetical protein